MNCFVFRKYVGLYCFWGIYFAVDCYMRFATGINWRTTRHTMIWTEEMNYTRLAIAWVQLFIIVLLVVLTVFLKRKEPLNLGRKEKGLFLAGILFCFLWRILTRNFYQPLSFIWWMWGMVSDLLKMVLITTGLSWALRLWLKKRKEKGK